MQLKIQLTKITKVSRNTHRGDNLFMVIPRKINFTQWGGMACMLSKPIATHSA